MSDGMHEDDRRLDHYRTVFAAELQNKIAEELGWKAPSVTPDSGDHMFGSLSKDELEVWSAKGKEYTNGGDRLANFNGVAKSLGVTPLQVWAVYISKHYYAIMEYVRTGREGSEGIESRLVDLANYAKLGRLLVRESRG